VYVGAKTRERQRQNGVPRIATKARLNRLNANGLISWRRPARTHHQSRLTPTTSGCLASQGRRWGACRSVLDATVAARIRGVTSGDALARAQRWVNPCYWRERRGPNLIQSRMPTTTSSSQGENKMCAAKPRMARATMAMRIRAMIASVAIGVHSCRSGGAHVPGCRRRLPASIGISPDLSLRRIPDRIRADPGL
jgi:hypothetical protein